MIDITEIEAYLKKIFDLESKMLDKDHRIALLEFELELEKQLLEAFKLFNCKANVRLKEIA